MANDLGNIVQKSIRVAEQIENLERRGDRIDSAPDKEGWQPPFDLYHVHDQMFIDLELPGVPPSLVDVLQEPGMIVVRGEKPELNADLAREEIISKRRFGTFVCQFAIPPGHAAIDLEQKMENGMLHLKAKMAPESTTLVES